jgi:hypothetical protein
MSGIIYRTTEHKVSEDSNFQQRRGENLRSSTTLTDFRIMETSCFRYAVRIEYLNVFWFTFNIQKCVHGSSFSPWRPRFDAGSVHVRYVVEKSDVGTGLPHGTSLAPVSIIPPTFRTFHMNIICTRRTSGLNLGTFKLSNTPADAREQRIVQNFHIVCSLLRVNPELQNLFFCNKVCKAPVNPYVLRLCKKLAIRRQ